MTKILLEWGEMQSHWLVYFRVENVDKSSTQVLDLGGEVLHSAEQSRFAAQLRRTCTRKMERDTSPWGVSLFDIAPQGQCPPILQRDGFFAIMQKGAELRSYVVFCMLHLLPYILMRSRFSFLVLTLVAFAALMVTVTLGGCTVTTIAPVVEASRMEVPTPIPTPTPQPAKVVTQTEGEAEADQETDSDNQGGVEDSGDGPGKLASVTANILNVRSGPGITYLVLGKLKYSDKVQILELSEDSTWYRICCLADRVSEGWVAGAYLALVTDAPMPEPPQSDIPFVPDSVDLSDANIPDAHTLWNMTVNMALDHLPETRVSYPPQSNTNPLTGLPISEERLGQRAVAVCIPSDLQARPQAGLSQADVVYEYLVDGELVTRMTGIFFGEDVPLIGPIRSARLINFYLGYMYNAATMCSGASDHIRRLLWDMADFPYFDIDLDNSHGLLPYSFLVGNGLTRFHTSTDGIHSWLADTSREQPIDLQGFEFGVPLEGGIPVSNVRIPYPAVTNATVDFRYYPDTGQYLRFVGDEPHFDRNGNYQIAPQNVIVQYVPHASTFLVEDALGSRSLDHDIFGSGPAYIFRNGLMYAGTWHTGTLGQLVKFRTADGKIIPLNPGRSWIALVPSGYQLATD